MSRTCCRICGFEGENQSYLAHEMLFGWRDEFTYFQCSQCECLQIAAIPENIQRYYPEEYGSYQTLQTVVRSKGLKGQFRIWRNRLYLDRSKFYTLFLSKVWPFYEEIPAYLKGLGLNSESKILDLGCGSGTLLSKLQSIGFKNLTGADPFLQKPFQHEPDIKFFKKHITELNGRYDLIMLHHVFEHMPDPHTVLAKILNLLTEKGVCLIRIPIVSCYAWEKYRTNWVALEAPRHFYLYSLKSLKYLADLHGFEILKTVWDSHEFQFWGSEQYLKGIPLMANKNTDSRSEEWFYPALSELRDKMPFFREEADRVNKAERGDQIQIFLRKGGGGQ